MAPGADQQKPPGRLRRAGRRVADAGKRFDGNPRLVTAAKLARELLPGDSRFGDPLSTAGREQPHVVGRRLSELTEKRPGLLREGGLSALQVWQALSEAQGRGRGERELTLLFTDLVGFSDWALRAGDDAALDLLRDVGQAIEPPIKDRGGEVVKWLGDGMMATLEGPQEALDATFDAQRRLAEVEAEGYEARIRAAIHSGRPRKVGGDYLGVDVNIAARMAEQGSADEILISERALAALDASGLEVSEKQLVQVKGVPEDIGTFTVTRSS
jgi:adenylate cyclase